MMIVVTGAAGFIASGLAARLNDLGEHDLLLVDDFSREDKRRNYADLKFRALVDREEFLKNPGAWGKPGFVFHLGARTDTAEQDEAIFAHLNLEYSKAVWNYCSDQAVPLVYASSAATYGLGEYGYKDEDALAEKLQPLNPYGRSKNDFDKWALRRPQAPPRWVGVKFFNVYGPNEYHKGRMASVVFHAFRQIRATGAMKLFRSHREDIPDGQQKRDFIYVKDVVDVLIFFMQQAVPPGLYNLGTGEARPFWDLASAVFHALNLPVNISFIDTPEDIRETYQYYTRAEMSKLRAAGYVKPFTSLEEGVREYVQQFLMESTDYTDSHRF